MAAHSTVANLGTGVNPITFSDDGLLFVGLAFMADSLFEVYLDGRPPRLINATPGINAFDWWDGYLYAPRPDKGEVVRIDVDAPGGNITPVVTGLVQPSAVDISDDGRMYVLAGQRAPSTSSTRSRVARRPSRRAAMATTWHRLERAHLRVGRQRRLDRRALPNGKYVTISRGHRRAVGAGGPAGAARP